MSWVKLEMGPNEEGFGRRQGLRRPARSVTKPRLREPLRPWTLGLAAVVFSFAVQFLTQLVDPRRRDVSFVGGWDAIVPARGRACLVRPGLER
ncbi:hypothetical protein Ct61P_00841 [Colletotrichum tofieldiae]|nr:hypothetical protein Ct61P_00841 [Colletotrichum tofieldiae]